MTGLVDKTYPGDLRYLDLIGARYRRTEKRGWVMNDGSLCNEVIYLGPNAPAAIKRVKVLGLD